MPPKRLVTPPLPAYAGLELISAAVLVTDARGVLLFMNTAAEDLFAVSAKSMTGQALQRLLPSSPAGNQALFQLLESATTENKTISGSELNLESAAGAHLHCAASATPLDDGRMVIELAARDQAWRIAREERILERQELNRELLRNLAHEIKNPLGGIRGAAQLLARELASVPSDASLQEYTDVIVKEAGRLQALMDRLLTPHRRLKFERINVHEVVERVRRMVLSNPVNGIVVDLMAMAARPDSTPLLGTIASPTLVIIGDEDHTTPLADATLMAERIPGAKLAIIPGAGHLSNVEQPTTFNRVLREFLQSLAG